MSSAKWRPFCLGRNIVALSDKQGIKVHNVVGMIDKDLRINHYRDCTVKMCIY